MSGSACPACGAASTRIVLELDRLPVLCNVLHETREQARGAAMADMRLASCGECGHVFNAAFEQERVVYGPDYENSLHFSPRFARHADEVTRDLARRHDLEGRLVVELGCGRGDFLRGLCREAGCRGLGFDPSFSGESADADDPVRIRPEPFSGRRGAAEGASLLACRHVLEHLAEPVEFLRGVHRALSSEAVAGPEGDRRESERPAVFFEVPNVLSTLRDGAIWDLIYEHCGYFAPTSLTCAFRRAGFADLEVAEAFEGQFLTLHGRWTAQADADASPDRRGAEPVVALAESFAELHRRKTREWERRLERLAEGGRPVVAWGAGSKGVTFLNVLEAGAAVTHLVDVNPRKHGRFVPGGGQEVVPPEALRDLGAGGVIVMNPVYREEIAASVSDMGLEIELLVA